MNKSLSIIHSLVTPSEIPFKALERTTIPNITLIDVDHDTQLCTLRIETVTTLLLVHTTNHSSIRWITGSHGEGMENTMVEVEGTITGLNEVLQSMSFRALYQMNDSMVLSVRDGVHFLRSTILLVYMKEEHSTINDRFWVFVLLACTLLMIWCLSIVHGLCKLCCKSHHQHAIPRNHQRKEKEGIELMYISTVNDKVNQPSITTTSISPTSLSIAKQNNVNEIHHHPTRSTSTHHKSVSPIKITDYQVCSPPKRIPPPLPHHPPPELPLSSKPIDQEREETPTRNARKAQRPAN